MNHLSQVHTFKLEQQNVHLNQNTQDLNMFM